MPQNILNRRVSQTASAFGLSGLQQSLSHHRDIAAVAFALPAVHTIFFTPVAQNSQLTKTFPSVILELRISQAAAAFLIALGKLREGCKNFVSAVATASPNGGTGVVSQLRSLNSHQSSEPLPGNIPLPGPYFGLTATILYRPSL